MKGKFIVIDGTDGSGKGTQTRLLVKKLRFEGYDVLEADFPRYGKKSAALVEEYLNGKLGKLDEIDAYQASILFACDRFAASKELKEHLNKGGIIISNRYVTSNMIHQTTKIKDDLELKKFLTWLEDLEYNIFKIPKPDMVFFLNITPEISMKLVDKKSLRKYIEGGKTKDIHEEDESFNQLSYKRALEMAKSYGWKEIKCVNDNKVREIEDINNDIYWDVKLIINQ